MTHGKQQTISCLLTSGDTRNYTSGRHVRRRTAACSHKMNCIRDVQYCSHGKQTHN